MHGLDDRFCAVCNRASLSKARAAAGGVTLEQMLAFLNQEKVRATYGAVAEVLGVPPRSLGAQLGSHRPETSWVVNPKNGLPTAYSEDEWDPALLSNPEIITSGRALTLRMSAWKGGPRKS